MSNPDHPYPYFAVIGKFIQNIKINSIDAESGDANITVASGCPFVIKTKNGFGYSGTGNIPMKNIRVEDKVKGYCLPLPIDLELLKQKFG